MIIDELKFITLHEKSFLLDHEVAKLLGIETRALNQTMKRVGIKVLEGSYFKLNKDDFSNLKKQGSISKYNGKRAFVFTLEGLLTAAMVTHTKEAAQIAVELIRYYFQLKNNYLHDRSQFVTTGKL